MGRPSTYTAELASEICTRLAAGETLRGICRSEHIPPASTVRGWVMDEATAPGFAAQYTQARDMGLEVMADELFDIADETSQDTITDAEGNARPNSEWITRSRLRVDTRKWYLSKLAPKRYGDRLDVAVTGDVSFGARLAAARAKLPGDSE